MDNGNNMTTSLGSKIRGYAQLARLSNLATVVSNVFVGGAIALHGWNVAARRNTNTMAASAPWPEMGFGHEIGFVLGITAVATLCFYTGGMALNDAIDARVDRLERPQRPIPSGRLSLLEAYGFVGVSFAIGLGLLAWLGERPIVTGLVLIVWIVGYDVLHKRHPASVLLMGLCRGWVYVLAGLCVAEAGLTTGLHGNEPTPHFNELIKPMAGILLWLAGIMVIYTVGLTTIARSENLSTIDRRRWLALVMPALVLSATFVLQPPVMVWSVSTGLLMAAWMGRAAGHLFINRPDTRSFVAAGICGIALIDAYFLALLDQPGLAMAAVGCFGWAVVSQRFSCGS